MGATVEVQDWAGQTLLAEGAIAVELAAGDDAADRRIVATIDDAVWSLQVNQLREFLECHQGRLLVAADAAVLLGDLLSAALRSGVQAITPLVDVVASGNLLDVGLYGERLAHAQSEETEHRRATNGEPIPAPSADDAPGSLLTGVARRAQLTLGKYHHRRRECERFIAQVAPNADAAKIARTLGSGVDVMGAYAAQVMQDAQPLDLPRDFAERIHEILDEHAAAALAVLRSDTHHERLFHWSHGRPAVKSNGVPHTKSKPYGDWLERASSRLRLEHDVPAPSFRKDPWRWDGDGVAADVARCIPGLDAMQRLWHAVGAKAWLDRVIARDTSSPPPAARSPHAAYVIVPALSPTAPNWGLLAEWTSPELDNFWGERLIVVELDQLYLRCLANVNHQEWPQAAQLARYFAGGEDPVEQLTIRVREAARTARPASEGQELSWATMPLADWPDDPPKWRQFVDTMLWAITHGMTHRTVLQPLLQSRLVAELNDRDAHDLLLLFQVQFPESYRIYVDPCLQCAAGNLGISEDELDKLLWPYLSEGAQQKLASGLLGADADARETMRRVLRVALEGKGPQRLRAKLETLWRKCYAEATRVPTNLRPSVLGQRLLPLDRIGPPVEGLYHRLANAKMLADVVRKYAAFLIAYESWPLIAMVGDRFYIDRRRAGNRDVAALHVLVNDPVEDLLRPLANRCVRVR